MEARLPKSSGCGWRPPRADWGLRDASWTPPRPLHGACRSNSCGSTPTARYPKRAGSTAAAAGPRSRASTMIRIPTCSLRSSSKSLKRHFRKAPQLARMQPLRFLVLEPLQRLQPDLEMLSDTLAIELARHARELDLAMQRLVGDAQQRAVGHAEAVAVGGDRGGLHVERDRARLRHAPDHLGAADFPIAVVDARDRSGPHQALELEARETRDLADRLLQRDLHLGQRRDRHPQRQLAIKHMVLADIAMRQHIVAEPLRIP